MRIGRHMRGAQIAMAAAAIGLFAAGCGSTPAAAGLKAPKDILVGTLYATTGAYTQSSMPQYHGLEYWAQQVNAKGGVYVKAYNKKIPVKIVSYNDQSLPLTATTLYGQLITQNKVNVLVADFGSVLTAPAVTVAEDNKQLLFDETGTGANFFTPSNKYIVLTGLPTSQIWPDRLVSYLISKKINKIAIVYCTNDFDASQDNTIVTNLKAAGITPVYNQAVGNSTSNYQVLINNIAATHPQAVLELGFPNNDIPFLQNLQQGSHHFNFVFTIFPGQLLSLMESNVGTKGLAYTYTYPAPPLIQYNNVNYGLSMAQFAKQYPAATGHTVKFATVSGYNTGLVIQKALGAAKSLSQTALRAAVASISGSLNTLDGQFKINSEGAQVGELLPVGQLVPQGKSVKMVIVAPSNLKTGTAVYPAP